VFTDYREMLSKADIDAVLVCTPDDQHYPMVRAALERELHVVCEKPFTMNAGQAKNCSS
jgi:predicted dehydrogenase